MEIKKVSKYEFLRENYRNACEKFIETYIKNLKKRGAKFECTSLLFGFRNALRIAYEELSREREIATEKATAFDGDNEFANVDSIFNNKNKIRKNFFDDEDKFCYEFIKKEIAIWRIYGYVPEKEYLSIIFESSLGKFLTKDK